MAEQPVGWLEQGGVTPTTHTFAIAEEMIVPTFRLSRPPGHRGGRGLQGDARRPSRPPAGRSGRYSGQPRREERGRAGDAQAPLDDGLDDRWAPPVEEAAGDGKAHKEVRLGDEAAGEEKAHKAPKGVPEELAALHTRVEHLQHTVSVKTRQLLQAQRDAEASHRLSQELGRRLDDQEAVIKRLREDKWKEVDRRAVLAREEAREEVRDELEAVRSALTAQLTEAREVARSLLAQLMAPQMQMQVAGMPMAQAGIQYVPVAVQPGVAVQPAAAPVHVPVVTAPAGWAQAAAPQIYTTR